jgi:signal transduction histidine kinase
MQAYQEAFTMQKQLRTEFRAVGAQNPWRLLLLTPLGSDSLQHVSLREYGGFICSVVDITSEKNAEFAEREAATDAHERREQQERFIDMISHEIRNPLSAMLHSCEDIEDAIEDPDNVYIARIEEAIEAIGVCIQVRNDKYSMRARVRLILV